MREQLINALGDVPDAKRLELARQLEDLVGRLKNAPAPTSAPLAATAPDFGTTDINAMSESTAMSQSKTECANQKESG